MPSDTLEGTVAVHRADLQAVLAEAAGDVRLGVEITAVEQDADGVMARSANGSEEHGDVLVGADGLNSVVRRTIVGGRPHYAGYTAWRGVSPLAVDSGRLTEAWGVDAGLIRVEQSWDPNEGPIKPKSRAGRRPVPLVKPLRAELAAHRPGGSFRGRG